MQTAAKEENPAIKIQNLPIPEIKAKVVNATFVKNNNIIATILETCFPQALAAQNKAINIITKKRRTAITIPAGPQLFNPRFLNSYN